MTAPDRVETARLVLERFNRRTSDALFEAVSASLPELHEWLPWAHPGYKRDDAAAFVRDSLEAWKEGRAYDYAIRTRNEGGLHVGNVSIWPVSKMSRTGEIGYWVRTDRVSRGIATEATDRIIRLGFEDLVFHKVTLRIAIGNRASEKVAEKLGFTREGVLREELLIRGRWIDHTLYSLLDHEYRPLSRTAGQIG